MDAVEFLKERERLICAGTSSCSINCSECRLDETRNKFHTSCDMLEFKYPEEYVAIIEQWSKDCPKEPKLKPCPFCGGNASLFIPDGYSVNAYSVCCGNRECGISGYSTEDKAINAWNKRVGEG